MTLHRLAALTLIFGGFCLIGFRISWLIIEDRIVDQPRNALLRQFRKNGMEDWYNFFQCPWCISFWVEVIMVAVACHFISLPWPILWPFAINAVTAPLHQLVDKYLN